MGLYAKYFLPWLLNREMGSADFNETRNAIVGQARGVVLEIGFGSGYNLPSYKNIARLYALEPSRELYRYAEARIGAAPFPVEYLPEAAERIPLPDGSVDSVVSTWTLCSVHDIARVLSEIKRVLKPNGLFFFAEHGLSPRPFASAVQKLITPISKHFTGNCHLDRAIDTAIVSAGFTFKELRKLPEKGRPLLFSYKGIATKK